MIRRRSSNTRTRSTTNIPSLLGNARKRSPESIVEGSIASLPPIPVDPKILAKKGRRMTRSATTGLISPSLTSVVSPDAVSIVSFGGISKTSKRKSTFGWLSRSTTSEDLVASAKSAGDLRREQSKDNRQRSRPRLAPLASAQQVSTAEPPVPAIPASMSRQSSQQGSKPPAAPGSSPRLDSLGSPALLPHSMSSVIPARTKSNSSLPSRSSPRLVEQPLQAAAQQPLPHQPAQQKTASVPATHGTETSPSLVSKAASVPPPPRVFNFSTVNSEPQSYLLPFPDFISSASLSDEMLPRSSPQASSPEEARLSDSQDALSTDPADHLQSPSSLPSTSSTPTTQSDCFYLAPSSIPMASTTEVTPNSMPVEPTEAAQAATVTSPFPSLEQPSQKELRK